MAGLATRPSAEDRVDEPLPRARGFMSAIDASSGVRLEARIDRHAIFPGRSTDVWTYSAGGGRFNPLLLSRTGSIVDVTLANALGEDTTIHWHGLGVDERNDGSGMYPVRTGRTYVYRFQLRDRAGLYWYHPHPHDRTGAQIHHGMGGALLVRDEEDDALRERLRLELGATELPLVIRDMQVDTRNRIQHSMGEDDWIGNRMMVNWTPDASARVEARQHRLRILNGSNARTFLIALTAAGRRLPLHLLGTDGGLLERPVEIRECFLAPAQRIDVLVDFSAIPATRAVLESLEHPPMDDDGRPESPGEHPGAPPMGSALRLMTFDVSDRASRPIALPAQLSRLPILRMPDKSRGFRLHIDGNRWLINGYNYRDDMEAIIVRVKRGAVEHWEIANDMRSMPHPMHLHGFRFRVVSRVNSPPAVRRLAVNAAGLCAQDLGLQDTVLVWPGERVRIAIDFAQPYSGVQRYMFHCHNLEHEDQGMMMNFAVED